MLGKYCSIKNIINVIWKITIQFRNIDLPGGVGVPDNQVCIRAFGNPPFLWIKVEDFGCSAAGDCHESIFIHFAAMLSKANVNIVSASLLSLLSPESLSTFCTKNQTATLPLHESNHTIRAKKRNGLIDHLWDIPFCSHVHFKT